MKALFKTTKTPLEKSYTPSFVSYNFLSEKRKKLKNKKIPEKLLSLQNSFSKAVLEKKSFEDREDLFRPLELISLKEAFSIYKNNYLKGLLETLKQTFEATQLLLGERSFNSFGLDFILKNKSKKPFLSDYGKTFPEYLGSQKSLNELSFLKDLASFEWLIKESALKNEHKSLKTTHPVEAIYSNLLYKTPLEKSLKPLKEGHHFNISFQDSKLKVESFLSQAF